MSTIVDPTEVMDAVGISVSSSDIAQAQSVIETVVDVNLSDAAVFAGNLARDQRAFERAVIWQTAFLQSNPDALLRAPDVASASTNGNSITFVQGVSEGFLAPLAAKCLERLSWRLGLHRTSIPVAPYRLVGAQTQISDEGWPPWSPL